MHKGVKQKVIKTETGEIRVPITPGPPHQPGVSLPPQSNNQPPKEEKRDE